MSKRRKKCVRGTTKTVNIPFVSPQARQYLSTYGSTSAKRALLGKSLSVTFCTDKDGRRLVKSVSVASKAATKGAPLLLAARRGPKAAPRRKKGWSKKGWVMYHQPSSSDYLTPRSPPPPPPPFDLPSFTD